MPYKQLYSQRHPSHTISSEPILTIAPPHVFAGNSWFRLEHKEWIEEPTVSASSGGAPDAAPRQVRGALCTVQLDADGVWLVQDETHVPLRVPAWYRSMQAYPDPDIEIRDAAVDAQGQIWLATSRGACVFSDPNWWTPLDRSDGMPYDDLLCIACSPDGAVWAGTPKGAWRLHNGTWNYFYGDRWVIGEAVTRIALDTNNDAWLLTDRGISIISERGNTLADKARHYTAITEARHVRHGFVSACILNTPGNPDGGITPRSDDNDGLWTALYAAAQTYEWAVTGDEHARERAARSMQALYDLIRYTGIPGYPARSLVRDTENAEGMDLNETVRIPGETDPLWFRSPVDPSVMCKGDTSSDELDGHYFAWYVWYTLGANESEREELRTYVAAVTDHLLEHGFTLVGHTGRRTRWGVFAPEELNDNPQWVEERGLNSAEMLSYLTIASHICGDPRYEQARRELAIRHHYVLNTLEYRRSTPWFRINHSDDELAFLVWFPLVQLEPNPAWKAIYLKAAEQMWTGHRDLPGLCLNRSPFYAVMYSAMMGRPEGISEALQTLREWPWDLTRFTMRNSHRHDITFRSAPGVPRLETTRALPYSERSVNRWNSNPFVPDGGNGGVTEEDGSAWLLPYWMGRYYRLF